MKTEWIFENKTFNLKTIEDHTSSSKNNILIKPLYVGICGSDLFAIETANNESIYNFGHEWVGEILESESSAFSKGDLVTSAAHLGCGKCDDCLNQRMNHCQNSFILGKEYGALRKELSLDEHHLVKLENISPQSAVLFEVAGISFEGMKKLKQQKLDHTKELLIIGAGPIGIFSALQAKKEGIPYQLLEVDQFRIEQAKKLNLNIEHTSLYLINNNQKFTHVLDCSGDGNNKEGAWKYIPHFCKEQASVLIIAKYINQINLNSNQFALKEINLKWLKGTGPKTLEECYQYWKSEINNLAEVMITHTFPYQETPKAFKVAKERDKTVKVLIKVND